MKLVYPLSKKGTKTSGFGPRWGKHHNGIDIAIPDGSDVISVADGEVVRSDMRNKRGYGNFIIIKHNVDGENFYSAYAHLTQRLVDVGDKVKQGQKIAESGGGQGLEGGGGKSTGPHLHFEIRKSESGNWVNPEKYLSGAEIVSGEIGNKETVTMTVAQKKKVPKMESKTFFSGGNPIKIISTPSDHAKRSTPDWSSRHAWDIQAPIGTSVYSLTHGKVAKKHESSKKKKNIFGTQLSISGENGDPSVFYTHLDSVKLEPGDKVKPGDFIGKITEWPSYPSSSHVHIGTDQGKDIFEFMDKEGIIKNAPDVPSDEDAPEQVEFNVVKVDKEKIKKALEDFFSTGTKKLDDIEAELNKQNATMYPNKKISEEKNRILDIFSKIL